MSIKKITAIINELKLSDVEKSLESHGVCGFSVYSVKGRGSSFNIYSNDHLTSHSQIEIYTSDRYAHKIAKLIMSTVDAGIENHGMVAITPVDELFWVHNQQISTPQEFKFHELDNA